MILELETFNNISYIIFKALLEKENTLYINVKTLLNTIYVASSKDIGLMPNYFKEEYINKFGYYNYYMILLKTNKYVNC